MNERPDPLSINPDLPTPEAVDLGENYGEDHPMNELRFPICWPCSHNTGIRTLLVRQSDGLHCPTCPSPRPLTIMTVFPPEQT